MALSRAAGGDLVDDDPPIDAGFADAKTISIICSLFVSLKSIIHLLLFPLGGSTIGALLSFVCVFFSLAPPCIDCKRALGGGAVELACTFGAAGGGGGGI